MTEKIIRVFPRKTKATPTDNMAFIGDPGLFIPDTDEIHISVSFTYDIPEAERLSKAWETVTGITPKIGGPAFGLPSGEFIPGRYLKEGYTITSRGCPNKCWFCSVWKREGNIRELEIKPGHNILDDNLLACSEQHIKAVFAMLRQQKKPAEFTGGLESKILKPWHIEEMINTRIHQMFFAYDTEDDYEPLKVASEMLLKVGFNRNYLRCYCLIGYPTDTMEKAEKRLIQVLKLGMFPMAMLWKNEKGDASIEWKRFQRLWVLPASISHKFKEVNND